MKKIISMLLAVGLCISGNAQIMVQAQENVLLQEEFDTVTGVSDLSENWDFKMVDGTGKKSDYTPLFAEVADGGKALSLYKTETLDTVYAAYTFPNDMNGSLRISYSFMPGENVVTTSGLLYGDEKFEYLVTFSNDKSLSFKWAGNATDPYTLKQNLSYNKWYDVSMYIDLVGGKVQAEISDRNGNSWKTVTSSLGNSEYNGIFFRIWSKEGTSYFDNIKVEQIPLGLSIETGKDGNIFDQNDNETFNIVVGNASDELATGVLECEMENEYTRETDKRYISFSVSANETVSFDWAADIKKFGTYIMTARLKYYKNGVLVEDNEERQIRFSKILASNNGERNTNVGIAPDSITANTDTNHAEKAMNLFDKAGFGGVRTMITWQTTEGSDRILKFNEASQDVIDELGKRDMKNIITLGLGNTNIVEQVDINGEEATPDVKRVPRTEEDVKAYGLYCRYMAEQTKDFVDYYEVWNEFDGDFNADRLDATYYVAILKEAYTQIKDVNPNAVVLSCSWGAHDSFRSALEAGIYDWCDGFIEHAYVTQSYFPNKYWLDFYQERQEIVRQYEEDNNLSTRKKFYFGENGISSAYDYAATGTNWLTLTDEKQAEAIPKYVSLARGYDLTDCIHWYSFYDLGTDRSDKMDFWGVMYPQNNLEGRNLAKPSYAAAAAMNKLMNGGITPTNWPKLETLEQKNKYINETYGSEMMDCIVSGAYSFNRGAVEDGIGNNIAVLWSDEPRDYVLKLGCETVDVYDLFGNKTSLSSSDGVYNVSTNGSVVYVAGDFSSFEEAYGSISTAEYDENKKIMHISGFITDENVADGDTVIAGIYKADELVKEVPLKINNGTFDKIFSIMEQGTYTIKVGDYAEKEITVDPNLCNTKESSSIDSSVSMYLDDNMNLCIEGQMLNYTEDENVSIIIVPQNSEVNLNSMLYINQLEISADGKFSDVVKIEGSATEIDVYIGASSANRLQKDYTYNEIYKVKSLNLQDGNQLSASALIYNTTDSEESAVMMIAQYSASGALISVVEKPVTAAKTTTNCQLFELSVEKDANAYSYKAFLWDSMSSLKSLFDAQVIEKGDSI